MGSGTVRSCAGDHQKIPGSWSGWAFFSGRAPKIPATRIESGVKALSSKELTGLGATVSRAAQFGG